MIDYYKKYLKYKNKYLILSKSLIGGDPSIKYLLATVSGQNKEYDVVYQIKDNNVNLVICYSKIRTDLLNEYIEQNRFDLPDSITHIDPIKSIDFKAIVRIQGMSTHELNGAIGIITMFQKHQDEPEERAKIFILESVSAVAFVQSNPASKGNRHILVKKTNLELAPYKAQYIRDL